MSEKDPAGRTPEMERLVIPEEGGIPRVFADVGETKGLRENGLHQGETKDLAREKAKKKQRETGKWSRGQTGEGFAGGHRRVGADISQRTIAHYLSIVNRYS